LVTITLLAVMVQGAAAQISRGSIRGSVTDPSGSLVPNVEVQARNLGTSLVARISAGADGSFTLANLPPGAYEVTAELPGFKVAVVQGVVVNVGVTTRVDIKMELGGVTERVVVTETVPVITPDTAESGTVITGSELDKLPLAASSRVRNPTQFAALTPGVVGDPGGGNLSLQGSQGRDVDVLVDGMSAGQVQVGGSFIEMANPVDSIREFKIVSGAFSAEYGHVSTGAISFGLKSGTNDFHGSLFYFFRNEKLNARSFFEQVRSPFRQNNFGGTAGGPVRIPGVYNGTDRTFFMVSTDISVFRGAGVQLYTSPTADFLTGDFSALRTVSGAQKLIYDPLTHTPFPGNVIPKSRISPISRKIADLYPKPNLPGLDANFLGVSGCPQLDNYMTTGKIDHHFNNKHSVSGSVNVTYLPRVCASNPYVGTPLVSGAPPIQDFKSSQYRLSYDSVITPKVLNQVQVGYNRFINLAKTQSAGQDWPAKLGIPGTGAGDGSLPSFAFSGEAYPAISASRWDGNVEENMMFKNTTTVIRGRHSMKFGMEARRQWFKTRNWANQSGSFTFSFKETGLNASTNTGNSFASFLLGAADSANISTPTVTASARPYYAWFAQDDIKVRPRLTLNLGLRYDLELPPYEAYDRASTFDLHTPNPGAGGLPGAMIFAGEGAGRTGTRTFEGTYYRAFGPRIGLAYGLSRTMVVRMGYAISYSSTRLLTSATGFSTTANWISPDNGNTPALWLDQGVPTNWPKPPFLDPTFGNNNNVSTSIPGDAERLPMTQNWRLDLQRELPGGILVEMAYVGTRGTHLGIYGSSTALRNINQVPSQYLALGSLLTANINSAAARAAGIPIPYVGFTGTVRQALRPYPQVLTISSREDKLAASTYHAFQFRMQKRFARGLQYMISYTNSKLITDSPRNLSSGQVSAAQDTANLRPERAVADYDTPQLFWLAMTYELPFGPGRPYLNQGGPLGKIIGGWSLSPILSYKSGTPLAIQATNTLPIFNGSLRPNRVAGVPARNEVSQGSFDPANDRVFNRAAFELPPPFTFGNSAPRLSDARNFGSSNEDLNIRKDTRINERFNLEFTAEFFNLLNRAHFGNAQSNISTTDFGRIVSSGLGRFIQFGLKLHF
jgi:hypothetical protein